MNLQVSVSEPIGGQLHLLLTSRSRFTAATWLTPDDARSLAAHIRTGEKIPTRISRATGFVHKRGQLTLEQSVYDTVSQLIFTTIEAQQIGEALLHTLRSIPRHTVIEKAGYLS